jgi:cbb3-type cytochrome oxidase subunit 3
MNAIIIVVLILLGIGCILAFWAYCAAKKAEFELDREPDAYFDIECVNCIDTNCMLCGRK